MFLPIGDHPNPRSIPWVNYLLLAANVVVWLFVALPLMSARPDLQDPLLLEYLFELGVRGPVPAQAILEQFKAYDLFVYKYGFRPADPSVLTLFSAMFLHGSWMHLLGNMLFLWIFGNNVEHRLGSFGYLLCYLGTGIAATLFFALFMPGSQVPLIGASGAISGVLGFYFLWFPRNLVKVFIFLFPFLITTVMVNARLVLGVYLVLDNILPFLLTRGGSDAGVAYGAHIGGFLAGLAVAWGLERVPALNLWRGERRYRAERTRKSAQSRPAQHADGIHHLLAGGHFQEAADAYLQLTERHQRRAQSAEDILAVGDYLRMQGRDDLALPVYRRFIAERPESGFLDRAYLGAGLILMRYPRHITSAYQYFLQALDVARSEEVRELARNNLRTIERLEKRTKE